MTDDAILAMGAISGLVYMRYLNRVRSPLSSTALTNRHRGQGADRGRAGGGEGGEPVGRYVGRRH